MKSKNLLLALSFALGAIALTGCADDPTYHPHHPPQDPPDYHGVPTDTRPPSMLDDAPPAAAPQQPQ
ncbi:hypothetical protein [Paraburkholderia phosphatilytica]|uniref:hypothetical protein n=1 Tax=Paraburkholderia phosphatilytica TaxID=2282883 RepID=UPI000E507718|nr:hypothetical protein [Paraburkholderia phosphatilytica]